MVAPAASSSSRREDTSSSEQRELVRRIVITKDYYEILGLQGSASEEDLKRAYRKLALKLHPDKCTAPGADEAFKAVSRAFSCLSDGDKRAAYDRYGSETPGLTRRPAGARGPFGAQGEVDPEELFNMFFNGGFGGPFGGGPFGGPGARVFHANFGGGQGFRRQYQQQRPQQPAHPLSQLLQFLPVLLLLLWTFMQMPSAPVYSLDKTSEYKHHFDTARLAVPYFVKDAQSFERQYPAAGRDRSRLEREVETVYRQKLEHGCYVERSNQQKLYNWGQRDRAKNYPLPHCDKLRGLYGLHT